MINKDSALTREFWEKGRLEDCPILDFHAHMGPDAAIYFPSESPEAMIHTMERCGTKLTVFCSHRALSYPEHEVDNLNVALRYPEYFKAYHAVVPNKTDFKTARERLEKYPSAYFGFKFHCDWHKTPLTDVAYKPFLEYMNENRLPALLHAWGGSENDGPEVVAEAASRYPAATFFCGHCFHSDMRHGLAVTKDCPNLYYELTAVLDDYGSIEMLCEAVGSERILFGTDLPWFDTHHGVGAVLSAETNDEDRRNILYRNGEKLLNKRYGAPQL